MMHADNLAAAVDLGNAKITAIVARKHGPKGIEVLGLSRTDAEEGSGPKLENPHLISEKVRLVLNDVAEQANVRLTGVYVSVGGHLESVNTETILHRSGTMQVIGEEDINTALRNVEREHKSTEQEVVHVLPQSFNLDGSDLRNIIGMRANNMPVRCHVMLASTAELRGLKKVIENAGVSVDSFIVKQLANAEATLRAGKREHGTVLLDMGSSATRLIVFYQGAPIYTNSVPVGGYHLSNDLSVAFGTSFEHANDIKLQYGSCLVDKLHAKDEVPVTSTYEDNLVVLKEDITFVLKQRVEELIRMIQVKLNNPDLKDAPLENFVLTAGGANLPGLVSLFRNTLQKNVERGKIKTREATDDSNDYVTAFGMLMWAARHLPPPKHTQSIAVAPVATQNAPTVKAGGILGSLFGRKKSK